MAIESPEAKRVNTRKKFMPYLGNDELPKPDSYTEKGLPLGKNGKPFTPKLRYAVENNNLVAYHVGRGGVKKRGIASLAVSTLSRRTKDKKYQRVATLRAQLKKDGVIGA